MAYAKFDDGFADHPKNRALSDGAFRLHVSGILHSARWLTDGAVPADAVTVSHCGASVWRSASISWINR
jgi:hypothetical protein